MDSSSFYSIVIIVAALVLWRRIRAMHRPIKGNGTRLLLPILFLLLPCIPIILNPKAHAAGWEWICAVIFGCLLSIPLIWTNNYELRSDQHIYAVRNKSFIITFLIILIIRFLLRDYLKWLGPETEAALFMTVALGYILPWRIISFIKFRQLYKSRIQTNDNIDFR
ncbi:cobalamin biosynthesis protein CbiX [Bacillus pseudomycoides]|uniref:CcdC protein domain-containing protein n=1 Tax=Bacillus pseudomycoides TaxID=64104 RepID=UPI000BED72EF|nr:CcdC protein domain-containing protein [Bacillus pseudomycoides]PEF71945.1 cobalamin biosynthesis protein CbiX [Bacillus pseudomycoides]PEL81340.1 cobalamin biosynthesis protein CbiX [Bacillus pseudomycoides]